MGIEFQEGENMGIDHELGFSGFESFGSSSSSSDLSTLVGSELDSTEVESTDEEDDEFMAELTRRMADYMLQEDDDNIDDGDEKNLLSDLDSENFKVSEENDMEGTIKSTISIISSSVKESNTVGHQSSPAHQIQPIQFYQLENQPRVANVDNIRNDGRRGKRSELTQPDKQTKNIGKAPLNGLSNNYGKGYPASCVGSGMRVVFLGGVGSRNAPSGTGVFLPRNTTTTTNQPLKKSGCSTVLIPTRVLQALEQHFSNVDSLQPSNRHSPQHGRRDSIQEKGWSQSQPRRQPQPQPSQVAIDYQLSQLPQEWTY